MLNQVYRLVSERQFEPFIVSESLRKGQVIIRPEYLSICHADQRYYGFHRRAEIINAKLPMALVHEGMGTVVASLSVDFAVGDRVAIVPNIPAETKSNVGANYLKSSKFMSSSADGLMREYVIVDELQAVHLSSNIGDYIGAFIEMMSVGYQAIQRVKDFKTIGIWGDGNVSYIVAALLKSLYPDVIIYIFGHHKYKLDYFSFVEGTFLTNDIPDDVAIDIAFEATGGRGSHDAIQQIIEHIVPEGRMVLMGVSEDEVPINTRLILEKGLRLFGSSRSVRKDFEDVVSLLHKDDALRSRMEMLVDNIIDVKSPQNAIEAFEADENHSFGKTIIRWSV